MKLRRKRALDSGKKGANRGGMLSRPCLRCMDNPNRPRPRKHGTRHSLNCQSFVLVLGTLLAGLMLSVNSRAEPPTCRPGLCVRLRQCLTPWWGRPCWCPDTYFPKCPPQVGSVPWGCVDDYKQKCLPAAGSVPWGCVDDYCPKCCPIPIGVGDGPSYTCCPGDELPRPAPH